MQRSSIRLAMLAFLFSAPSWAAASSPWDGTWKLDQAKSKMTGDMFTLTALPDGGFHLATPSHTEDRDYPCDGTDYKVTDDRSGGCKRVDDKHYDMGGKRNGKPEWHGSSVVSDDGKSLTNTAYVHRPDGSDMTAVDRYERVGAGRGRAGTWRNVKSTSTAPETMNITLNGDTMRMEIPEYKVVMTAKLDGSTSKLEGAAAPPNMTFSMKAESPTKLDYITRVNGKPRGEGTDSLSADGKILTQEEWEPGNEGNKQVYVYMKQ